VVPIARVVALTRRLLDLGAYEVAVSDTIGIAHPAQVRTVLTALLNELPADRLALHFHDTRGMAVANVEAALELGIRTFDSSAGGLGGCPYAPGATGNVATDDLLYLFAGHGYEMGIDTNSVAEASLALESALGHPLPSRALQAYAAARARVGGAPIKSA
jgi:hydroxymethylglutaryl-CoA lyase